MKKYYASADELFVNKGQQVWPREEALQMKDGLDKSSLSNPSLSIFDFWTKSCNTGKWVIVFNKNIPTCVETGAVVK